MKCDRDTGHGVKCGRDATHWCSEAKASRCSDCFDIMGGHLGPDDCCQPVARLGVEVERLRTVIRTGGAMYRAERVVLGVSGLIEENIMVRAALEDRLGRIRAMWIEMARTEKTGNVVNWTAAKAAIDAALVEEAP